MNNKGEKLAAKELVSAINYMLNKIQQKNQSI
jgi:hypothetical protein